MDNPKDVPYIVYESEAARHERTVKRLLVALAITIALLFASNLSQGTGRKSLTNFVI